MAHEKSPRLKLIAGGEAGEHPLPEGVTRLGRGVDCDLQLADPKISRHQADIIRQGERIELVHTGSNPTFVNGAEVDRIELGEGDEITMANRVIIRLALRPEAPAEESVPSPPPAEPEAAPPTPEPALAAPTPVRPPATPSVEIPPDQVRLAIVGAGPAGLAAAVRCTTRGVKHVLLERGKLANTIQKYQKGKFVMDEPQVLPLHGDMGVAFRQGSRESILDEWENAASRTGMNLFAGPEHEVLAIEGQIGAFRVRTKSGNVYQATHVVLSIGVQGNLRAFGVPGDDLPHVTYQLDDPTVHAGKRAVVFGVGDAGIENALALAENDAEVSLVNRGTDMARAKALNRTKAEGMIAEGSLQYFTNAVADHFEPDVVVMKTNDGEVRLDAELVIGRLGAIPPRRFLESVGIELSSKDPAAVPEVSERYETNVPGLFIVGALAGYPLIKNCMNQGYEVVEHIIGNTPTPADEPLFEKKFKAFPGSVGDTLDRIRSTIPLFSSLTTVQLREFLFDSELVRFDKGATIFELGEFGTDVFCILEGSTQALIPKEVDANTPRNASPEIVGHVDFKPGDFFGETAVIGGRPRTASVVATADCVLVQSPRFAFLRLLRTVEAARRIVDVVFVERFFERLLRDVQAHTQTQVSMAEIHTIAESSELLEFRGGERVYSENDEPDGVHFVRRGTVFISEGRKGLASIHAGNYFGHMALLAPTRPRAEDATASVATETIRVPGEAIQVFVDAHPELRRFFEAREEELEKARHELQLDQGGLTMMNLMNSSGAPEATDFLIIDESLCIRCNNCEEACARSHDGVSRLDREAGPTFLRRNGSQLHVPTACQHCESPKCMDDCPPGDAIRRAVNGEVYITDQCIGCGNCASNCPYGVIQMATIEEYRPRGLLWRLFFGEGASADEDDHGDEPHREHAIKCDLCRELPEPRGGRQKAACAASCPTGALSRIEPKAFFDDMLEGKS